MVTKQSAKQPNRTSTPKKPVVNHPVNGRFMAQSQIDEIRRRAQMGSHVHQVQLAAIEAQQRKK